MQFSFASKLDLQYEGCTKIGRSSQITRSTFTEFDFFLLNGLPQVPVLVALGTGSLRTVLASAGESSFVTTFCRDSINSHFLPFLQVNCCQQIFRMQCRIEQRAMIKFMVAQDKSPIQCWRDLQEVYGARALGKTRVRHWHKLFSTGNQDTPTADQKHPGQSRSARTDHNIELIHDLLEDD